MLNLRFLETDPQGLHGPSAAIGRGSREPGNPLDHYVIKTGGLDNIKMSLGIQNSPLLCITRCYWMSSPWDLEPRMI